MIGYFTLAEAMKASFPPDCCRLAAVREYADHAVALFDTRPGGEPYLYEVHYGRMEGRWSEGSSSNARGWSRFLDAGAGLGVATEWGEAPPGADAVRGELAGQVLEEAVEGGVYLLAWWGVPSGFARVTAFRIGGEWIPVHFNGFSSGWLPWGIG